MRFVADLHISPLTIEVLRAGGCDVVWVWEELSPVASDLEILDYARRTGRVILTEDLDFSTLLALGGHDRPSLVTLRLSATHPREIATKILAAVRLLEERLTEGCAITVEDKTVRLRKLPIR